MRIKREQPRQTTIAVITNALYMQSPVERITTDVFLIEKFRKNIFAPISTVELIKTYYLFEKTLYCYNILVKILK